LQQDVIFKIEVSPLNGLGEEFFSDLPGVRSIAHSARDGYSILELILDQDDALGSVLTALTQSSIHIINLEKREPTLEDVFVDLVGKSMAEVEQSDQGDQGDQGQT
jgi:ABC-2 type transport system ATP-binding protein